MKELSFTTNKRRFFFVYAFYTVLAIILACFFFSLDYMEVGVDSVRFQQLIRISFCVIFAGAIVYGIFHGYDYILKYDDKFLYIFKKNIITKKLTKEEIPLSEIQSIFYQTDHKLIGSYWRFQYTSGLKYISFPQSNDLADEETKNNFMKELRYTIQKDHNPVIKEIEIDPPLIFIYARAFAIVIVLLLIIQFVFKIDILTYFLPAVKSIFNIGTV